MGREGTHLCQFHLRATCYGSLELSAGSPNMTLAALRLVTQSTSLTEANFSPRRLVHRHPIAVLQDPSAASGQAAAQARYHHHG